MGEFFRPVRPVVITAVEFLSVLGRQEMMFFVSASETNGAQDGDEPRRPVVDDGRHGRRYAGSSPVLELVPFLKNMGLVFFLYSIEPS